MPMCPYCHTIVSEGIKFCPECGDSLQKGLAIQKKVDYFQELETSAKDEKLIEKPKRTKVHLAGIIVGSIVATAVIIGIIIAATVIYNPTPATHISTTNDIVTPTQTHTELPSLTTSERNYIEILSDRSSVLNEIFDELSNLMNEPQLRNDQWINELAIQLAWIQVIYEDALEIEPPNSMSHIHYKFLQAMFHYNECTDLLAKGLDNINAYLIDQAISEIQLGTEYVRETTELVGEFLASHAP